MWPNVHHVPHWPMEKLWGVAGKTGQPAKPPPGLDSSIPWTHATSGQDSAQAITQDHWQPWVGPFTKTETGTAGLQQWPAQPWRLCPWVAVGLAVSTPTGGAGDPDR